jgi:chromosome partitioning protein
VPGPPGRHSPGAVVSEQTPAVALSVGLVGEKGGVGKTTAAVNLAGLAAFGGLRTLVWDLDPQGAASYALGFAKLGRGATRHLTRSRPRLRDAVFGTEVPGLDLVPADVSLRSLDLELHDRSRSKRRIADALRSVVRDYDVVLVDCPPGITLGNEAVMRAVDVYLAPIVPTALGVRSFEHVAGFVDSTRKADGQLRGFFSMVDRRKRSHREITERAAREHDRILETAIPTAAGIEITDRDRPPFTTAHRRSRAWIAYRDLWIELQTERNGRTVDLSRLEAAERGRERVRRP